MTKKIQSKSKKLAKKSGEKRVQTKQEPKKSAKVQPKNPADNRAKVTQSRFPRHPKNPYRPGAYATAFDIIAARKSIRRDEFVKLVAEATGKDLKHAGYDVAAGILSAKESVSGPRHRSAKDGFYVKRENDHLTLILE